MMRQSFFALVAGALIITVNGFCSQYAIRRCLQPLTDHPYNENTFFPTKTEFEMKAICGKYYKANLCMKRFLGSCGVAVRNAVDGLEGVYNYICKGTLSEYLKHRVCFKDRTLNTQGKQCNATTFEKLRQFKLKAFYRRMSRTEIKSEGCRFITHYVRCVYGITNTHCGERAATWMENLLTIAAKPSTSAIGCAIRSHVFPTTTHGPQVYTRKRNPVISTATPGHMMFHWKVRNNPPKTTPGRRMFHWKASNVPTKTTPGRRMFHWKASNIPTKTTPGRRMFHWKASNVPTKIAPGQRMFHWKSSSVPTKIAPGHRMFHWKKSNVQIKTDGPTTVSSLYVTSGDPGVYRWNTNSILAKLDALLNSENSNHMVGIGAGIVGVASLLAITICVMYIYRRNKRRSGIQYATLTNEQSAQPTLKRDTYVVKCCEGKPCQV